MGPLPRPFSTDKEGLVSQREQVPWLQTTNGQLCPRRSAWMLTQLLAPCFISRVVIAQDLPEREQRIIRGDPINTRRPAIQLHSARLST
jgi:hypothetical protein